MDMNCVSLIDQYFFYFILEFIVLELNVDTMT